MTDLTKRYNSIQYLLSGSHISTTNALESRAGIELFETVKDRFRDVTQAQRFFSFYDTQNKVSETVGKAYQNFERVFSANDKKFKIFDLNDLEVLQKISNTIELFESKALPELKQNITIYVVIVTKEDSYDLLFLPVDDNFRTKKEDGEIISYNYTNEIEVTKDYVKIGEDIYENKITGFPVFKLIEKDVKKGVSWSPTFDYLGSLKQLLIDRISIEWQKLTDQHPIAVTAEYTCRYTDDLGNKCESGKIKTFGKDGQVIYNKCPNCGLGVGPGQQIEVKGVVGSDKAPDLNSAYQKVNTDIKPLQEAIKNANDNNVSTYEAITGLKYSLEGSTTYENEKHLVSDKEKAETIFTTLSTELTKCEQKITDYILLAEKGKIYRTIINLGSDFYLVTKHDLLLSLSESKSAGAPMFMVSDTLEQLNSLENKDIAKSAEFDIWTALEPFAGMSLEEVQYIASNEEKYLKANFITIVSQIKLELKTKSFTQYFENTNQETGDGILQIQKLIKEKLNEQQTERNTEAGVDTKNSGSTD